MHEGCAEGDVADLSDPTEVRAAAMEAIINLGCLHSNKQRIVQAGAAMHLVRCVADVKQSDNLRELAATCIGCLTHLCDGETADDFVRERATRLITRITHLTQRTSTFARVCWSIHAF
jgi:hypothetical protein